MELRVRHKELNEVALKTGENAERVDIELDILLKNINDLRDIWQGKDSKTFCDNSTDYLEYLRNISHLYRLMGNFIENIDKNYREIDDNYSQSLNKMGDYYE